MLETAINMETLQKGNFSERLNPKKKTFSKYIMHILDKKYVDKYKH